MLFVHQQATHKSVIHSRHFELDGRKLGVAVINFFTFICVVFEAFTANKKSFLAISSISVELENHCFKDLGYTYNQQVMITSCTDLDDQGRAYVCNIGF
jgi:hypothetical protein